MGYPVGEDVRYTDESKDILKSILNEDSDGGVDNCDFADNKGVLK